MSDLMMTVGEGELSHLQAVSLYRHIEDLGGREKTHWHYNECRCCVTLHGPDCAYVIGRDGEATFFAEKGCGCRCPS